MVRRVLLILVTGLLVARPFVIGEDPTMDAPLENLDAATMLLTMLWFVAAVLWAVWRVWSRQGAWYGGLLEAALFAVVLLTFAGAAFVAPYKYPAWLMAWEWLGMAAGFFLLRQLAVTPEEQHCFFAVLLATMVVLSVYALYQAAVEIPENHHLSFEEFRTLSEERAGHPIDLPILRETWDRAQKSYVYGPYAHPNSFASVLALLLPGVVGAALLCARHKHPQWQVMLASCFATLGVVALGLTVSRGAWLATLLTALGVSAFVWRDWVRHNWYYAVGAVAVLALLAIGVSRTDLFTTDIGKNEETAVVRVKEYWPATWQMIAAHPWFGVGPGQFGRYYPRYMAETAGETIKDPHNFALEIWATCGVFALLALLAVIVLFYRQTIRDLLRAPTVDGPGDVLQPDRKAHEPPPVHWEFYLGAMFGLLLSFVLRVMERPPEKIVTETIMAGVGSVFWFGSFALYEQIRWSNRARVLALVAGVTAMLLTFLIEGGINSPSVAGLLWCAAALALNSTERPPNGWGSLFKPLLYIPLPAVAAIAVLYVVVVFQPVTETISVMKSTMLSREQSRQLFAKSSNLTQTDRRAPALGDIQHKYIPEIESIKILEETRKGPSRGDAKLCILLATLDISQWETTRRFSQQNIKQLNSNDPKFDYADKAVHAAADAQKLDPVGAEGYAMEYGLRRQFANDQEFWAHQELDKSLPAALGMPARRWQTMDPENSAYVKYKEEAKHQYRLAEAVMKKWLPLDPNNARLNAQLADCLIRADEPPNEIRPYAERALDLHRRNKRPTRMLSNEQSMQLDEWLTNAPGK